MPNHNGRKNGRKNGNGRRNSNAKLVSNALGALQKEYMMVGRTRVRAWDAWLVIGLMIGILAGILFVANRSGEFEKGEAIVTQAGPVSVFLDPASPSSRNIAPGATNVEFLRFKVVNNTKQAIQVSGFSVRFQGSAKSTDIPMATVWSGTTKLVETRTYTQDGNVLAIFFKPDGVPFSNIPAGTSKVFTVKANISTTARIGATAAFNLYGFNFSPGGISEGLPVIGNTMTIAPRIIVKSPNGGESWQVGSTHKVTWSGATAADRFVDVTIALLSADKSTHIANIAVGTPNDGSVDWTIPSSILPGKYIVRVACIHNCNYLTNPTFDDSNATFNIVAAAPSVTVISPNGGETWVAGRSYELKFNVKNPPAGSKFVKLLLLETVSSGSLTELATIAPLDYSSDYTWLWPIPAGTMPSQYRIFADLYKGTPGYETLISSDESNAPFNIMTGPVSLSALSVATIIGADETVLVLVEAEDRTDISSGPVITSFSASSGPPSTIINITGSGFSNIDNVIYFGVDIVASVPSGDGRTLSFAVPSVPSDVYFVGVITASGPSNIINFTVE